MVSIQTASPGQTFALGKKFARLLKNGAVLAIYGSLGSGKTTFVKGLARGLGIRGRITSPSFAVMTERTLPGEKRAFYHFDLYRLKHKGELLELGFSEILENMKNIVAVEWPEKAKKILPKRTITLKLTHQKKPNERTIEIFSKYA